MRGDGHTAQQVSPSMAYRAIYGLRGGGRIRHSSRGRPVRDLVHARKYDFR